MLILLLFIGNLLTCVAHSGLTCFNTAGGTCQIGIRPNSFQNISPRCCGGGAAADEVNCPAPGGASQGTIAAGSKFTVEWPARNHAVGNQNPDGGMTNGISIYLAPKTATTLGDYCGSPTPDQNCPNKICEASYGPSTCQGGTNGDNIPCTTECTMPSNKAPGDYNIMWLWDWRQNDGSMYSTCGDVTVSGAAVGPVPTASPPSPSPTTLAPTDPGQTRAPTRGQAPDQCNPLQTPSLVDNQIQFFNVPKELPYRACSIFLQEVYYKKVSNTLGVLVIDMVDNAGEWHGKGVEIIPGASSGRTTIVMHVWQGKPMTGAGEFLRMKAYFVEKSSYDEKVEDGSYSADPLAVDTSVESPPICAGCNYFRYCGSVAGMPETVQCMTQDQLNACPPQLSLPTECPVDGNMKPVAVNLGGNDSGAIHNIGTMGIFFSALFVLYM